MCNSEAALYALSYRLKSARQKTRAQKGDLEKHLIQLDELRTKLRLDKQRLSWVPLVEPYQKGWKRFFVLRDDVRRGRHADFYQTLLDKINTVQYSRDKAFRKRKRRMRRMIDANLEAELQRLENYIERKNLGGKIYKLTRSQRGRWNWHEGVRPREKHPFINKPIRDILAACKETETE